jgi:hypothetical protein
MPNNRNAARTAMVAACIAGAGTCAVSACSPAGRSIPAATASPTSAASPSPTAAKGVYGDAVAAAKYWQQQSLEDNCGLVSVADVVGEITGHAPSERQMITLAEKHSVREQPRSDLRATR